MPFTLASRLLAPLAVALSALGGGAVGWVAHGAANQATARQYLTDHPEAVPDMLGDMQAKTRQAALAPLRGQVETPFPGAVLGNPTGRVTLVEFLDYACGYCRKAVPDVEALVAANPDLRVVVREWPILTPDSIDAARMALAAAAQGKFAAFHVAMFRAGRPAPDTIAAAAREAGLDMVRARRDIASLRVRQELAGTAALARQIDAEGTPTWEIDGQAMVGALDGDTLQQAVTAARAHTPPLAGTVAVR